MTLPKKVIITEVSPRDGLQNESIFIPTEIKIQFIELLMQAGFPEIEITSFVNPKKIPALADNTTIAKTFSNHTQTKLISLIPNLIGLQNAIQANCKHISVITTVSETFAQKNMNCSIEESLNRIQEIIKITSVKKMAIRGYISCTMGCPYEGFIAIEKTVELAKKLFAMGCDEIAIADTIGTGNPLLAQQLIHSVSKHIPIEKIAVHFHDTYGQALTNIFACLELGVSKIDSSVGGLGGCPYAKGASGNVATEDVLYLLNGLNIYSGIDLSAAIKASNYIHQHLPHETRSKAAMAIR